MQVDDGGRGGATVPADDGGRGGAPMPVDDGGRGRAPVPVELEVTGTSVWQVACGRDKWQDVDPTWTEPLFYALNHGVPQLRLLKRSWPDGRELEVWYTADLSDHTRITLKEDDARKRHPMRVVQLKGPRPRAAQGQ